MELDGLAALSSGVRPCQESSIDMDLDGLVVLSRCKANSKSV